MLYHLILVRIRTKCPNYYPSGFYVLRNGLSKSKFYADPKSVIIYELSPNPTT